MRPGPGEAAVVRGASARSQDRQGKEIWCGRGREREQQHFLITTREEQRVRLVLLHHSGSLKFCIQSVDVEQNVLEGPACGNKLATSSPTRTNYDDEESFFNLPFFPFLHLLFSDSGVWAALKFTFVTVFWLSGKKSKSQLRIVKRLPENPQSSDRTLANSMNLCQPLRLLGGGLSVLIILNVQMKSNAAVSQ
ncbi:hypothetical protein EYF80_011246 [Liparis tanakae]|uniref:Uncharacterized protein n=1 Tax=Liparis tanakae TaxID=230148 RepID=A0A4Z2IMS1_9TELE|nr:hypothetical protein EYF80_011246 [Liparis tanakae]